MVKVSYFFLFFFTLSKYPLTYIHIDGYFCMYVSVCFFPPGSNWGHWVWRLLKSRVQVSFRWAQCLPFLSHLSISWELGMSRFLPWRGGGWSPLPGDSRPICHPRQSHSHSWERERSLAEQATNGQLINCLKDHHSNYRQIDPASAVQSAGWNSPQPRTFGLLRCPVMLESDSFALCFTLMHRPSCCGFSLDWRFTMNEGN